MSYFYTIFTLVVLSTSAFAMDSKGKKDDPPPAPNPVFETVSSPNTSVSNILSDKK